MQKSHVASVEDEVQYQYDQLIKQYMCVFGVFNEAQVRFSQLSEKYKSDLQKQLQAIQNKYRLQDQQLSVDFKATIDGLKQNVNDQAVLDKIDEYLQYFSELNNYKVGRPENNVDLASILRQSSLIEHTQPSNDAPQVQIDQTNQDKLEKSNFASDILKSSQNAEQVSENKELGNDSQLSTQELKEDSQESESSGEKISDNVEEKEENNENVSVQNASQKAKELDAKKVESVEEQKEESYSDDSSEDQ